MDPYWLNNSSHSEYYPVNREHWMERGFSTTFPVYKFRTYEPTNAKY